MRAARSMLSALHAGVMSKRAAAKQQVEAAPTTLPLVWEKRVATEAPCALVIGVDEAGRGPLAGPVVAAAVLVLPERGALSAPVLGINDSKQVEEDDRERIYEELMRSTQIVFGVSIIDHETIDSINILQATMLAMTKAVEDLCKNLEARELDVHQCHVLVDGPRVPERITALLNAVTSPSGKRARADASDRDVSGAGSTAKRPPALAHAEAVIKGDTKVYSIAAASIIAKVTRDRLMREFHSKYPEYGFACHKGYGTAAHMAAIFAHGPCEIHRKTFAPVKSFYPDKETTTSRKLPKRMPPPSGAKAFTKANSVGSKNAIAHPTVVRPTSSSITPAACVGMKRTRASRT